MCRYRLNGKKAEKWFQRFTNHVDIDFKGSWHLESMIRLLNKEMPKRLEDGVSIDNDTFPQGEAWAREVAFGKKKLSIPTDVKQKFSNHLLDRVVSTDAVIELPGINGKIERIAVDVTVNPTKESFKIGKIRGLPDLNDPKGQNKNRNIGKVRKELGITKHMLVIINNERALLPSYDHLLSELQQFAQSTSKIGVKNLRELPPELTIGGDYQNLAKQHQNRPSPQRLQAIARDSITRNDHPSYTVQMLLNDPAIAKITDLKEAATVGANYVNRPLSETTHYQVARSIEHVLKEHGTKTNDGAVNIQGNLELRKQGQNYSIVDQNGRGLIFQSDKLRAKVNKLTSTEKLQFIKYFNNRVIKPPGPNRNRGPRL